jgi:hypothetical protein
VPHAGARCARYRPRVPFAGLFAGRGADNLNLDCRKQILSSCRVDLSCLDSRALALSYSTPSYLTSHVPGL